jgi:aminopeptidase N
VCHRDSLTITEKIKLMTFECDPYIKQNAAQECWRYLLSQEAPSLSAELEEGLNQVLSGWMDAPELLPLVFGVPGLRSCQEGAVLFDFDGLLQKHQQLVLLLATRWEKVWAEILQGSLFQLRGVYKWDKRCVALRRAQALALKMLMQCNASKYMEQAVQIFESADNLTARCGVLDAVLPIATAPRAQLLKKMHKMADGHDLLMNKCLYYEVYQYQDSLEGIAALFTDARCDRKRPNSVMAWFSGWMHGHYEKLHQKDGRGYVVLKEAIKAIDTINPFTATRLVGPLLQYQYFDSARQEKMKLALKWLSHQNPSKNLNEKLTMVMQSVTA